MDTTPTDLESALKEAMAAVRCPPEPGGWHHHELTPAVLLEH